MSKHLNKKLIFSTVLMAVSIFLLAQVVAALALIAFGAGSEDFELQNHHVFVSGVLLALTMLGCLWWIQRPHHKSFKKVVSSFGFKRPKRDDLVYIAGGFAMYLVAWFAVLLALSQLSIVDLDQAQEIGFDDPVGLGLMPVFIAIVVLAPISEEFLFRGFLYGRLKKLIGLIPAALIVSLLFALAHFQLNVAIDTFVLSIVMIYAYESSGNLFVPIMIHALKNLLAFTVLFLV